MIDGRALVLGILLAAAGTILQVADADAQRRRAPDRTPGADPAVTGATPEAVRVVAGGRATVSLAGAGLDRLHDAAIVVRSGPVGGLTATLAAPGRDPGRRDVSITAGRGAAPARDLELVVSFTDRLRRVHRIATPVRIEVAPPAGVPAVAGADPFSVRLDPENRSATVMLDGWNLDALTGAEARAPNGQPASGIEARIRTGRAPGTSALRLALVDRAEAGAYTVLARWGRGEIELPVDLEVQGPPAGLASVTLSADRVPAGDVVTGTVVLDGPTPTGTTVSLSSTDPAVASLGISGIGIPAGGTSGTFEVATQSVEEETSVHVQASLDGTQLEADLIVEPVLPDLRFVSCSFDPPQNNVVWVRVVMENASSAPAVWPSTGGGQQVFVLGWDPPGGPGLVSNVPGGTVLDPGQTRILSSGIPLHMIEPGDYTISGDLDYLGRIPESDENNNAFTCPTHTFEDPARPDLVITDVQFDKSLWQAGGVGDYIEKLRLTVTVENQGEYTASGSPIPVMGEGSTELSPAGDTSMLIPPGGSKEYILVAPSYAPATPYTGTITVDPYGSVDETDETNNEWEYSHTTPSDDRIPMNEVALDEVTLSTEQVLAGYPVTGTVRLTGPSPSGTMVMVESLEPEAASVGNNGFVPISGGNDSATFEIATHPVESHTLLKIRATLDGVERYGSLTVDPAFPDLRFVSCSFDPPQNDVVWVRVVMENAGSAPAVWPSTGGGQQVFVLGWDPPGGPGLVSNVPGGTVLDPGQTRVLSSGIPLHMIEPGDYTISGDLDYLGRIPESDENNNAFTCPTHTF